MRKRGSALRVTIKIPRELYAKVAELIADTSFRSVSDFTVHVLRDVVAGGKLADQDPTPGLTVREVELIRRRLRALGYLE